MTINNQLKYGRRGTDSYQQRKISLLSPAEWILAMFMAYVNEHRILILRGPIDTGHYYWS